MSADSEPAEGQGPCETCGEMGHLICWDAGPEDQVGPLIALHDADSWTRNGDPVNRRCREDGCDCGRDG